MNSNPEHIRMQKESEETLGQTPLDPAKVQTLPAEPHGKIQAIQDRFNNRSKLSHSFSSHCEGEAVATPIHGELKGTPTAQVCASHNQQTAPRPLLSQFQVRPHGGCLTSQRVGVADPLPRSNVHLITPFRPPQRIPVCSHSYSEHDSSIEDPKDIEEIKPSLQNERKTVRELKGEKEEMKGASERKLAKSEVKETNIFRRQLLRNERRARGVQTFKERLNFPDIPRTVSSSTFSSVFRYMKKLITNNRGRMVGFLRSVGFKQDAIEDSISAYSAYDLYCKDNIQLKTLKHLLCKIFKERSIYAYLMQLALGVILKSIDKAEFTRLSKKNLPAYKRIVEVCYEESIRVLQRKIAVPDVDRKLQFKFS